MPSEERDRTASMTSTKPLVALAALALCFLLASLVLGALVHMRGSRFQCEAILQPPPALAAAGFKPPRRRHPQQVLTPEDADAAYAMLAAFGDAASAVGMRWWVESGTLLGAVRNGGIVPNDDDLDVDIDRADEWTFLHDVMPVLEREGYTCERMPFGWKIFRTTGPRSSKYGFPGLDVFVVSPDRRGNLRSWCGSACFPNCYFRKEEVGQVTSVPFGPVTAMLPQDPLPFLERCYGTSWNDVWYRTFDHATERRITRPQKSPVLPADRVAAWGTTDVSNPCAAEA